MNAIVASLGRPDELLSLFKFLTQGSRVQYKRLSDLPLESHSNYSFAICYYLLNQTSRSFATVIQSLHVELRHPVAIFYLVLRGLDTIEDDMTLDQDLKIELLQRFSSLSRQKGYNFNGSGPKEKDAVLLRNYEFVVKELSTLKPVYQDIILDICQKMGDGMAYFIRNEVITIKDYDLYTHYVAGLVGIGLTRLFQSSGLETISDLDLANKMGLFLQKVNISKDFLQDIEEGRLFWPREIWARYVEPGKGPEELAKPENKDCALAALNHLAADALELVPSCLEYLSQLKEPSVFQFAAIPQVMAIATFDLFYNNYDLFTKRGTKIRKGLAIKLIQQATDFENTKKIYLQHVLHISATARSNLGKNPEDQSFESILINCARIVRWIKDHDYNNPQMLFVPDPSALSAQRCLYFIIAFVVISYFLPVVG